MKNLNKWGAWLGAGAILFTLTGCADRNKNGQPDDVATSGEVANTADKMGDAAANTADKMGDAAAKAGDKVADAAQDAGKAIAGAGAAAVTTPSIKTALGAQKALNGSSIDVDTNGTTKTVTLKGTVKNAAQKSLAEAVTKKNAPDYKVVNQLKQAS